MKGFICSLLGCFILFTGATQAGESTEYLVKFKSEKSYQAFLSQSQFSLRDFAISNVQEVSDVLGIAKVTISNPESVQKVVETFRSNPSVQYIEPNFKIQIDDPGVSLEELLVNSSVLKKLDETLPSLPDDPEFSKQWSLFNTGQEGGKVGADIQVVQAWEKGYLGDSSVVVAVIDTGVARSHPDLKENIFINAGEIPDNGIDDDANGYIDDVSGWNAILDTGDAEDDHGHGTHCAGVIGAIGNNTAAIAGVNRKVSILPIKFLSAGGGGTVEGAVKAITYATKMGVKIMSNSWGGKLYSQAIEDAVKVATDAGILFIAAAGNDGTNNDRSPAYPAGFAFPNVVAVAASDPQDSLAKWPNSSRGSNYGPTSVHVAAPGLNILSTVLNGETKVMSGTSMAAPHVSGIAALMLSVKPDATAGELKAKLIETSDPTAGLQGKVVSGGRVNTIRAIQAL